MTTYFRVLGWVLAIGIGWMGQAEALSQFSLLTGNRCINCHVSTQGGAQRDELLKESTPCGFDQIDVVTDLALIENV